MLAKASQVVYSPLVINHPYAVSYPYLNSPLIAPFPAAATIILKHHTPEHTAEQEAASKANEEKEKMEKPLQPPVVSLLPYPLAAAPRFVILR